MVSTPGTGGADMCRSAARRVSAATIRINPAKYNAPRNRKPYWSAQYARLDIGGSAVSAKYTHPATGERAPSNPNAPPFTSRLAAPIMKTTAAQ